ncbi:MAG: PDDEXK nuclease domain-containing protein [Dysgonamonadaceae bacterium]|jgi:predicted nuclease of restriction endonuclease-like (RecB) superfamily|nr:PDDEXK nuclease domain-containing protein [Dysgonamonadaceae bacterium]
MEKGIQKNGNQYNSLVEQIGGLLLQGRRQAAYAVNNALVQTYWHIGKYIVEYEQGGLEKSEYGSKLLDRLSKDLTMLYGKGFSRSNLMYVRKLYIAFPIGQTLSDQFENKLTISIGETVSHQLEKIQTVSDQFSGTLSHRLSWSHYVQILTADNPLEISFYTKQCEKENWSVRELKRQMNSMLFHRLALSKDKKGVLAIAEKGAEIQKPEDIIKEHFVFEFLGIPQQQQYLEGELEEKLILNLENFLLELGKGFAFVKRQYRVPVGNRQFSVDLVFYHIILKCYVLIDLKRGEVEHGDIGQMNFYLNYFRKEVNTETDNEPIGIVLGAYKDRIMVEYAMDNINNQLFVSKYQLYLPPKEDLEKELIRLLENNNSN